MEQPRYIYFDNGRDYSSKWFYPRGRWQRFKRWIRAAWYDSLAWMIAADFSMSILSPEEAEERYFAIRECQARAAAIRGGGA